MPAGKTTANFNKRGSEAVVRNGGIDNRRPSGGELARKVKEALMERTRSTGVDVKVEVRGEGMIRLAGIVDVLSERVAAEDIARRVPGVSKVINDLTVSMDGQFTDKHIEKEVVERLGSRPETAGVGARVSQGVVTLLGRVENLARARAAVRLAERTRGVREVRSELRLQAVLRDDATITNEVERTLSARGLEAGLIDTRTVDGVVRLRGQVDDAEQRRQAEEAASAVPGVREVRNELDVWE